MATPSTHITVGTKIEPQQWTSITDQSVSLPDPDRLIHLQFRRFAGCPICNLHLRSITRRIDEITAAGVGEVVVFHSKKKSMLAYQSELPVDVIADPTRQYYRQFGVEPSLLGMMHPKTMLAAARGMFTKWGLPIGERVTGMPADFLIDRDGTVLAAKYGSHAADQWTVDELLAQIPAGAATSA